MGVVPGFDGIFEIISRNDSSGSLRRLKSVLLMPCLQKTKETKQNINHTLSKLVDHGKQYNYHYLLKVQGFALRRLTGNPTMKSGT